MLQQVSCEEFGFYLAVHLVEASRQSAEETFAVVNDVTAGRDGGRGPAWPSPYHQSHKDFREGSRSWKARDF